MAFLEEGFAVRCPIKTPAKSVAEADRSILVRGLGSQCGKLMLRIDLNLWRKHLLSRFPPQTLALHHRQHEARKIMWRRLHRTSSVGILTSLRPKRSSILVITVSVITLKLAFPNHAGTCHSQWSENVLAHQLCERLLRDSLHHHLEQHDSFAGIRVLRTRVEMYFHSCRYP